MNMQTGPAPKQSLDQWLVWTGIIEIANIPIFSFLCWQVNRLIPGERDTLSILGLVTLNLILLEGGIYWLLAHARFFQKTPARARLHLLQAVYLVNILLLLLFPALVLWQTILGPQAELPDVLLGAGFYLFGFGEFLHYFVFKINMRPYERQNAVRRGQMVPARILRELRRAENEVQTQPQSFH